MKTVVAKAGGRRDWWKRSKTTVLALLCTTLVPLKNTELYASNGWNCMVNFISIKLLATKKRASKNLCMKPPSLSHLISNFYSIWHHCPLQTPSPSSLWDSTSRLFIHSLLSTLPLPVLAQLSYPLVPLNHLNKSFCSSPSVHFTCNNILWPN